jgi:glycosyltransferase involved in cell wall biosynthesis
MRRKNEIVFFEVSLPAYCRREKPVKIIHCTNNAELVDYGTEREATNLAMAQQAHGSDVILAIDRPGVFGEICKEHKMPVIVHESLCKPRSQVPEREAHERAVQEFIALLEIHKPDIIHCHTLHAANIAIPAGNRIGIPCVYMGDTPNGTIEAHKRGLRFTVVCLTEPGLKGLRKEMPDIAAYYIPNGTRVVPREPVQPRDGGRFVNLVMAGKLIPRKCCDVAIMAVFELRRRLGSDCPVLNIYGDGPRRVHLAEMVSVLGLNDHVRFHGFKLQALEHCPSTDMLITASRHECSPLIVAEAMSRGMPVVTTDVGNVREMIPDERYGRVVPIDFVLPFAEAIESLLLDVASGKFNPDLPIERHRSLFSFEKWVERMEVVYEQALQAAH